MLRALGLMSGTSMDGVDLALVATDGERIAELGPTGYFAYSDEHRALLRAAVEAGEGVEVRTDRPGVLAEAEDLVTRIHADAVESFLAEQGLAAADVDVIGFHGQTVVHRPQQRLTVQLGDGEALARRVGRPVVYDFRAADVEAGRAPRWCPSSIGRSPRRPASRPRSPF
jgi:anhydro-N-acetylmuramic acid kinase